MYMYLGYILVKILPGDCNESGKALQAFTIIGGAEQSTDALVDDSC